MERKVGTPALRLAVIIMLAFIGGGMCLAVPVASSQGAEHGAPGQPPINIRPLASGSTAGFPVLQCRTVGQIQTELLG